MDVCVDELPDVRAIDVESLGIELRDYSLAQLANAASKVYRKAHVHRGIHAARRSARRFRAVLALLARESDARADEIDALVRTINADLSDLRDAQRAWECAGQKRSLRGRADSAAARRALRQWRDELTRRTLDSDPKFDDKRRRIERASELFAALELPKLTEAALLAALSRTANRMRRARHDAEALGTLEAKHRWRRAARRLRMQLQALDHVANDRGCSVGARGAARRMLVSAAAHVPTIAELRPKIAALGARLDRDLLERALRRVFPDATPHVTKKAAS